MRTTGYAGTIATALLVGVTMSSPAVAQDGYGYYERYDVAGVGYLKGDAYFAQFFNNCEPFRNRLRTLALISAKGTNPAARTAAADALRELRASGCPKGQQLKPLPEDDERSPVYNWTGFYIGPNVGYSWADNEFVKPTGPSIGVQIGAGVLRSDFYLGIESSFNFAGITGAKTEFGITERQSQKAVISVLGQLGYVTNGTLLYITGGITSANTEFSISGMGFHDVDSKWLTGATIGIGVKKAITPNISAGIQYLHTAFPSGSFFDGTIENGRTSSNTLSAVFNYRFGSQ